MEKRGTMEEVILPEEVIHHIQSFMTGKIAARSAILSKSWHSAWLTRPTVDLDDREFGYGDKEFERFAKKTMQRYQHLSLKVKRFRLRRHHICSRSEDISNELLADANKLGATDVELEMPPHTSLFLLKQVLGSESLLNFSLIGCRLYEKYPITCPKLKSLNLKYVRVSNNQFNDIISCCISLEELSLSNSLLNPKLFVLHNLKRMLLDCVDFDNTFTDFASRFPCLKELIASNSLETNV